MKTDPNIGRCQPRRNRHGDFRSSPVNDWLTNLAASGSWEFSTAQALCLGSAVLMGVVVAGLNRWGRRGEPLAPTFQTTLVLLAGLIAMSTQIIGDNIARAFSLAGAMIRTEGVEDVQFRQEL